MLDTTLFNVSLPNNIGKSKAAVILSGCRVDIDHDSLYSELEELNLYPINNNDFGCGKAKIELLFDNNFPKPYFKFYVQCITIRTDKGLMCKINKNPISDKIIGNRYSKVTKDGKVAVGLTYYFKSREQLEALSNSEKFCVEGFIAIEKQTDVYGFLCQMEKSDGIWDLKSGDTCQITKNTHIRNLIH